jgi:glycosyltransferase involved in cell wall biosynthesis
LSRIACIDRPLCIGTLAGLRPEKNLSRLIRAFAAVRARWPARLVLVGEGPKRAELQALAEQLGVATDVEFTGYLSNPGDRLKDFDLFALSSDTEQLPMALLEAMALGLPVVATRVGDLEALLSEVSSGSLCDPDDEAFKQALCTAVEQRSQWADWGKRGRALVASRHSEHNMVLSWQRVFDGLLV